MKFAPLLLPFLMGCALLGKNDPILPRYFTPEYDADAPAAQARQDLQLRLGRVEGWTHLRERLVLRRAGRELLYRDDWRWTELPETYLRRALSRALFEERGVVESLSARAVTLDVELVAFEEIEQPHEARLQAILMLHDERRSLLTQTITVDEPIPAAKDGQQPQALADALSQALHRGVTGVADKVVAKLSEPAAATAK
jgi:ABC-type uncharacterized transport system auxiliary subunit